uniref:MAM domain containing 4 n=1 Tax=Latimeria chalumnae TaxID=7897 RepID=H2ZZX6_LATCH
VCMLSFFFSESICGSYLQSVSLTSVNTCNMPKDNVCDFVCHCVDCSDENMCGFHKSSIVTQTPFTCDFELDDCGWIDMSSTSYKWVRNMGCISEGTGPAMDHTLGTNLGWYLTAESHTKASLTTAVLKSPVLRHAAATCQIRVWYHIFTGTDGGNFAAKLINGNRTIDVWQRPWSSSQHWRTFVIYTGRITGEFEVILISTHSSSERGDIAIDDLEFKHCGLPAPQSKCKSGQFACGRRSCVEQDQICDGTDDCGDRSEEVQCDSYNKCDFELGLCDWEQETGSDEINWELTNKYSIPTSTPFTGPTRDHTLNNDMDFLYINSSRPTVKNDRAKLLSPHLEATKNDSCYLVLYYYLYGTHTGSLNVYYRTSVPGDLVRVGGKYGEMGDYWFKDQIEFKVDMNFQIVIEGVIGEEEKGNIALDDLILSPGCKLFNGKNTNQKSLENSLPVGTEPTLPPNPCGERQFQCDDKCISENLVCNFKSDCKDGSDEKSCGNTNFEDGEGGWRDNSVGRFKWRVEQANITNMPNTDHGTNTSQDTGHYLYLEGVQGQVMTEAKSQTQIMGPSGLACSLEMYYYFYSDSWPAGYIVVSVINTELQTHKFPWHVQGNQGKSWKHVIIPIGERPRNFQVQLVGIVDTLASGHQAIAIDDIKFINCDPEYMPLNTAELSCNFDNGMCGWYQDQNDDFEWIRDNGHRPDVLNHGPGYDHTTGTGHYLFFDASSQLVSGYRAQLITYLQPQHFGDLCLSFWYYMYGPQIGTLNVKIKLEGKNETLLWTRKGTQGNVWHLGFCTLPHQNKMFQLIFEALYDGFNGHIGLDDINLMSGVCKAQKYCSFEANSCNYISSGKYTWVWQNSATGATTNGPFFDHTTEADRGYYMIADTSKSVLPKGLTATMVSEMHEPLFNEECLQFWYHMGGNSPGTLNVYLEEKNEKKEKLFSTSMKEGTSWRYGSINIRVDESWRVIFEALGAGGVLSHIAVDDLVFRSGSCSKPGFCDFELGTCGWSNTLIPKLDSYDWDWNSGATPSKYTGPDTDHTLGTKEDIYIYMEKRERDRYTQNLNSQCFYLRYFHCFHDKYNVFFDVAALYKDQEELNVIVYSKEDYLKIWQVRGHQSKYWMSGNITVESPLEFQIVFEVKKGIIVDSGGIALDDIEYVAGMSC